MVKLDCSGGQSSRRSTLFLFLAALAPATSIGIVAWPAYRRSGETRHGFNYASLWFDESPVPTLVIGDMVIFNFMAE